MLRETSAATGPDRDQRRCLRNPAMSRQGHRPDAMGRNVNAGQRYQTTQRGTIAPTARITRLHLPPDLKRRPGEWHNRGGWVMAEPNRTPWTWTPKRTKAAQLLADDQLSDRQIEAEVGVAHSTLWEWKKRPEFVAEIEALRREIDAAILANGIARRVNRIRAQSDRWRRMQRVIEERAADPRLANIPGGTTGLLVEHARGVAGRVVHEYIVDAALLKELRELERQTAQELGQWVEKVAPTSPDGEKPYRGQLTDEERLAGFRCLMARLGEGGGGPAALANGHANGSLASEPGDDDGRCGPAS